MRFAVSSLSALALSLGLAGTAAASLVTIDFNNTVASSGPPIPVLPYTEDGYRLRNGTTSTSNGLFDQSFSGLGRASDYFGWVAGSTFVIESVGGAAFSLISMDLGSLSSTVTSLSYQITGHLSDGGTVTTSGSAVNLSTVSFGSGWNNLLSVDVRSLNFSAAVDNIVLSNGVPEPMSLGLVGLGLVGVGAARRRRG